MPRKKETGFMILAVGTCDPVGAQKTVTDSYIEGFRKLGLNVHWLIFGLNPPAQNSADISYVPLKDNWRFYEDSTTLEHEAREQILRINKELQPKLIFRPLEFAYEPYLKDLAAPSVVMILLLNKPLIISAKNQTYAQEALVTAGLRADAVRSMIEETAYRNANHLVSNSLTTAADLKEHYPEIYSKNILCSAPGARPEFFKISPPTLRQDVLYFGRLTHQKGIPQLLRRVPDSWSLSVLGRGKWPSELFTQHGIHYADWHTTADLCARLQATTFCVFPSHYEPWGLSLNEALAAGRICIAQKGAGGHDEQIRDGENGFLFDFTKYSFWDFLAELWRGDPKNLLAVSRQAQKTARPWHEHLSEIAYLLARD